VGKGSKKNFRKLIKGNLWYKSKHIVVLILDGLEEINPDTKESNYDAIQREFIDVITSIGKAAVLPFPGMLSMLSEYEINTRKKKHQKWLGYSKIKGIVE